MWPTPNTPVAVCRSGSSSSSTNTRASSGETFAQHAAEPGSGTQRLGSCPSSVSIDATARRLMIMNAISLVSTPCRVR